ncbi:MAG: CHRD domain-containing protein [Steroidobacteraceae bacterium]
MSSTFKRAAGIATVVLLAAGVGLASATTIHVRLLGSREVPAVKTMARGYGVIEIAADGAVSGKVTTRGIRATMAHIHMAARGENGPIIIPLTRGPHGTWVVPAGSKLSAHQYKEFLAGDLYVNVHSAAHPGGEIRGQLKP